MGHWNPALLVSVSSACPSLCLTVCLALCLVGLASPPFIAFRSCLLLHAVWAPEIPTCGYDCCATEFISSEYRAGIVNMVCWYVRCLYVYSYTVLKWMCGCVSKERKLRKGQRVYTWVFIYLYRPIFNSVWYHITPISVCSPKLKHLSQRTINWNIPLSPDARCPGYNSHYMDVSGPGDLFLSITVNRNACMNVEGDLGHGVGCPSNGT